MTPTLIDTILIVSVFGAMLFCQVMSLRSKTKHNYKNSLFWDINTLLMAVNQDWIILDVTWYTTVVKGVLVGLNGLAFICIAFSAVTTIEYLLKEVPVIKPCKTAEDVIRREG